MPSYAALTNDTAGEERAPLLGGEDYRATILEVKADKKTDFTTKELRDVWTIKFNVTAFADGATAEDIEGNPVESRWLWRDLNPNANGFTAAGEPSVKRQFLLAANGIADVTAEIPAGNTDDLIGREVILSIRTVPGVKDGKLRNKISAIKPVSRRRIGTSVGQTATSAPVMADRQRGQNAPTEETAPIDDAYLRAVASLVNDTDDPDPEDIGKVARKVGR